jgi:hypothetical protein
VLVDSSNPCNVFNNFFSDFTFWKVITSHKANRQCAVLETGFKPVLFLFQIGAINSCPLIYVDGTEGQETLVLEHMKQHDWKDATHKKKGLLGGQT